MKSIFLGSALAVAAATGAQAADPILDVKAPREPVYRCDITGFIELPGTDVCFKVGGFARLAVYGGEDEWNGTTPLPFGVEPNISPLDEIDGFNMYGQARVNFDARTVTEYGTVRAFIEMQADDSDGNTGGPFNLRHAYVQFGNWTFGKTNSTFTHGASDPDGTDPFTIIGTNTMRRDQIRYTQSFGGGVSVSVALEDQAYNSPGRVIGRGDYFPGFATLGNVIEDRSDWPDVVANVNVSGEWGEAQLSGALHQNNYASYYPVTLPYAAYSDDELGWAALFGLSINTPMTGEGDTLTFKAIYTDGASAYAGGNNANKSAFVTGPMILSRAGNANVVWGDCGAAIAPYEECILDSVRTWSVVGSFNHSWTPTVGSWIGAGYQNTQADDVYFNLASPTFSSDLDVDAWEIFAGVSWTPVSRTTFMVDVHYGAVDFNEDLTPIAGALDDTDDNAFAVGAQVTRSF